MANTTDIARAVGIKRQAVIDVLNQVIRYLQRGEKVKLYEFGTFDLVLSKGRTLSSPILQDGTPVTYPDRHRIRFKSSPAARNRVNVRRKKTADVDVKRKTGKPAQ